MRKVQTFNSPNSKAGGSKLRLVVENIAAKQAHDALPPVSQRELNRAIRLCAADLAGAAMLLRAVRGKQATEATRLATLLNAAADSKRAPVRAIRPRQPRPSGGLTAQWDDGEVQLFVDRHTAAEMLGIKAQSLTVILSRENGRARFIRLHPDTGNPREVVISRRYPTKSQAAESPE